MKGKFGKLQLTILLTTVLPMLVMGIVITIFAVNNYRDIFEAEVNRSLSSAAGSAATMFDALYPGDYELVESGKYVSLFKGDKELTDDHAIVDSLKESTGMDVTLFYKDARILTTILDEDGNRSVGSGVNGAIYKEMQNKMSAIYYTVDINGERNYVCYIPLKNSDGTLVGMIGTGCSAESVISNVNRAAWPIIIVTVIATLLASLISIRYTTYVALSIGDIKKFLQTVINGSLDAVMRDRALDRNDELGDTADAAVKMRDALRVMVEKDPLTMLYNRRYGMSRMKQVQNSAGKTGEKFAIAIGDIDFFKKVNDTYGHDAGDEALRFVALELRRLMLGCGFAVRWGGEEFLLVFDKLDEDAAADKILSLLDLVRGRVISYGTQDISITMTFGLREGSNDMDINDMVKEADGALYYGKQHGRNQLVRCEDLDASELITEDEAVLAAQTPDISEEDDLEKLAASLIRAVEEGNEPPKTVVTDTSSSDSAAETLMQKLVLSAAKHAEEEGED